MHPEQLITESDYASLAEFRYQIRRFLHFSEQAARTAGIEPHQHQLPLALKGLAGSEEPPTIGILAERLQIQHHSAVELVQRLEDRGLTFPLALASRPAAGTHPTEHRTAKQSWKSSPCATWPNCGLTARRWWRR